MLEDFKANYFKVKVGEFEGPIELLLDLIERKKLHISDVSLSQVADEFVEYVKELEQSEEKEENRSGKKNKFVSDLADFILIASTLLLIKSKSLLPNLSLTEEEQGNIDDLEKRLLNYQKYKELSSGLGKIFGRFLYFAEEPKQMKIVFSPTPDILLSNLKGALKEALQKMPKKIESLPKVAIEKIISLEEMIEKLAEKINISIRTSFSDFANVSTNKKDFANIKKDEKVNIIVSFLAMLELVKRGAVRVSQNKNFEDIEIESENMGVPSYY